MIPDDKNGHYVLQKKNINVFFRNLMVPFLLFPLFGIYKNEAELGHKIFIPLLSGIVFIPIYLKMKKSFFLHKKKTNDHRSFYDFLLQDSLLEDNSISYEDFAINDKYLKSNERVAKSYRVTNTIGTLLLLGFTVLMYFVLNTMYNTKLSTTEKTALISLVNDFSTVKTYIEFLKNHNKLMLFTGIILYMILMYLYLLIFYIKKHILNKV